MIRWLTDPGDHHLVDVSPEQVGALAGWSTQRLQHGVPLTGIGDQHRPAAELRVPRPAGLLTLRGIYRGAVQREPRILPQVLALAGVRHRAEPQLILHE